MHTCYTCTRVLVCVCKLCSFRFCRFICLFSFRHFYFIMQYNQPYRNERFDCVDDHSVWTVNVSMVQVHFVEGSQRVSNRQSPRGRCWLGLGTYRGTERTPLTQTLGCILRIVSTIPSTEGMQSKGPNHQKSSQNDDVITRH